MTIFRNLILAVTVCCASAFAANPNPPIWPSYVKVFTTTTGIPAIQAAADAIFATNGGQPDHGQFVNQGYALLFAPGTYNGLDIKIGYYTSIIGLGMKPGDTIINMFHLRRATTSTKLALSIVFGDRLRILRQPLPVYGLRQRTLE